LIGLAANRRGELRGRSRARARCGPDLGVDPVEHLPVELAVDVVVAEKPVLGSAYVATLGGERAVGVVGPRGPVGNVALDLVLPAKSAVG
jgi:hypothetical protein